MKFLVVDDDMSLANMIKEDLRANGHTVELVHDGKEGSFIARSYEYDLVILDYSLPEKDGLQVCREIREAGKSMPIIFLSVNDETDIKVSAFNAGADDYLVKPFSLSELKARIQALLRRPQLQEQTILRVGDLVLDTSRQSVRRGETSIRLTRKEFSLLEYLMRNVGVVQSRAMIIEHVWTAERDPLSNTVEAHIRNLRAKLNINGQPDLIGNITGRGYLLDSAEKISLLQAKTTT